MQVIIEVQKQRRIINGGFKLYASDVELRQIVSDIEVALADGLVQGWVGIGTVDDPATVFPFNGKDIPAKGWKD